MEYLVLDPEVAGGLAPGTALDRSTHPPRVDDLHYVFEGWLGDELLETFPCFIATQALWKLLEGAGLSGVRAGPVRVSASEQFGEMYPGRTLPSFVRLHVTGAPGEGRPRPEAPRAARRVEAGARGPSHAPARAVRRGAVRGVVTPSGTSAPRAKARGAGSSVSRGRRAATRR